MGLCLKRTIWGGTTLRNIRPSVQTSQGIPGEGCRSAGWLHLTLGAVLPQCMSVCYNECRDKWQQNYNRYDICQKNVCLYLLLCGQRQFQGLKIWLSWERSSALNNAKLVSLETAVPSVPDLFYFLTKETFSNLKHVKNMIQTCWIWIICLNFSALTAQGHLMW